MSAISISILSYTPHAACSRVRRRCTLRDPRCSAATGSSLSCGNWHRTTRCVGPSAADDDNGDDYDDSVDDDDDPGRFELRGASEEKGWAIPK